MTEYQEGYKDGMLMVKKTCLKLIETRLKKLTDNVLFPELVNEFFDELKQDLDEVFFENHYCPESKNDIPEETYEVAWIAGCTEGIDMATCAAARILDIEYHWDIISFNDFKRKVRDTAKEY